jgi:hypothetical protein
MSEKSRIVQLCYWVTVLNMLNPAIAISKNAPYVQQINILSWVTRLTQLLTINWVTVLTAIYRWPLTQLDNLP